MTMIPYDVIISTCGKYADLWDPCLRLMEQNWAARKGQTFLLTDDESEYTFPAVELVAAGKGKELPQRLQILLPRIHTEYVVLTLDDYFLTQPIEEDAIQTLLRYMEKRDLSYMQMYPMPRCYLRAEGAAEDPEEPGYYLWDLKQPGDYRVCLTPGIWRKDFLAQTVTQVGNVWQFEVGLTHRARELGVSVGTSNRREFPYLDVIRKGKVLRKARSWFCRNSIYVSSRKTVPAGAELMLAVRTFIRLYMPRWFFRWTKGVMRKLGSTFYSA